jgi:ADP-heptose:LPS heptosyltransferase
VHILAVEKLVLHCSLSPGDVVMLTAAVESLHGQHPGRFLTDVRTLCPALWENNPYITRIEDDDPQARHIKCQYPLIHKSNQLPYHFIHGYIRHLGDQLNIRLEPVAFRGAIYLSDAERGASSLVEELTESSAPYWLIAAGGKYDYSVKWWHHRRWQEVVDHFEGHLQFVQVGARGHYHPPLKNVLDLRKQTNLRGLIGLVHHAAGILSPVTLLMHLAAAVPLRAEQKSLRPCVVVAGGREPVHWEAYPGHQYLHTIGALPCCARGGCWRSRTVAIGDGSSNDAPDRLCKRPMPSGLPECMEMIEVRHVVDAIEWYLRSMPYAFSSANTSQPTLTY